MKRLQNIIYAIAGLNLAYGTGHFILTTFGMDVAGWWNAAVVVSCIELLFVLLVMAAKAGKISRRWSVGPLALSALIQAVKVSGDIVAAKDAMQGILIVAISVVSVAALGCVVYLFELRDQIPSQAAPGAQGEAFNAILVSQAVEGAMNALRPEFAQLADATAQQVAQLQAQHEDVAGWVESIESRLRVLQTQLAAQPPQPVVTRVAQLTQPKQGAKIDRAQLVAGLHNGMGATELAQLFGVSDAAIRKTPEWKNRPVAK